MSDPVGIKIDLAKKIHFKTLEQTNFMKKILLFLALIIPALTAQANAQSYESDLDGLLKDYVASVTADGIQYNGVNYDAWGSDPRHATVRDAILAVDPASLSSQNETLAFWINAYNVLTIDLITRTGEQESIKNLGTAFNSAWKKYKWTISGKEYSLNNIEHDTIRKLGEPRIHFAVNCAAKSCPDIRAEAYTAAKLDAQLDEQTRHTLNNESKGYRKDSGNAVRITKVMDWYKEDFDNGNLNSWLAEYKPDGIDAQTKIKFFKYDWSLNKQ